MAAVPTAAFRLPRFQLPQFQLPYFTCAPAAARGATHGVRRGVGISRGIPSRVIPHKGSFRGGGGEGGGGWGHKPAPRLHLTPSTPHHPSHPLNPLPNTAVIYSFFNIHGKMADCKQKFMSETKAHLNHYAKKGSVHVSPRASQTRITFWVPPSTPRATFDLAFCQPADGGAFF